jgi:penicillin-binding protein 1A
LTPLEVATAYAMLANGGYRVEPYFIDRIEDGEGNIVYQHQPLRVCHDCEQKQETGETVPDTDPSTDTNVEVATATDVNPVELSDEEQTPRYAPRVMSEQINYIMRTILRDVIQLGTGRRALRIGRRDLAGKTGTTNDQKDAWFSGFSSELVTTTWIGFDRHEPLGRRETGASAALPMWIYFMENAMKGVPEKQFEMPPGLVTVRLDPKTGLLAGEGQTNAIFETFRTESVPKQTVDVNKTVDPTVKVKQPAIQEQLF